MKNFALQTLLRSSFIGLSCLAAGSANALIATSGVETGGATPELVLFIFDPVAEVSFSKDLGIYAAPFDPANDNSNNFFVQAQQDAGYHKFFDPLNDDVNFKEFLKAPLVNVVNQVWGIYAAGNPGFSGPNENNLFTTLTSGVGGGVINPNYSSLLSVRNQGLGDLVPGTLGQLAFGNLNRGQNSNNEAGNPFNTHFKEGGPSDPFNQEEYLLLNGSSFDLKGDFPPYFAAITGGKTGYESISLALPSSVNPVGSSSWFYFLTQSDNNADGKVLVDEFDNLGYDGYWGLAVDSDGKYILSYTLPAYLTAVSSPLGLQRRNLTDFSAFYGKARAVSTPGYEFAGWAPGRDALGVSPVPEPATYGLFALGLLALAWRARRQAH